MTPHSSATRKLYVSMMVSLDGFIEGPNRELDWPVTDNREFEQYCDDMLDTVDLLLFGRVAYQMMVDYWPAAAKNPASSPRDIAFARKMNRLPKLVLSRTLDKAEWNARVLADRVPEEIRELKRQPGKDIAVVGGAGVISTLTQHRLVDEYRAIVNPIVLGSGNPLFKDIQERISLRLSKATTLRSGLVILYYEPIWP
jgi:dihydrofolate reductase